MSPDDLVPFFRQLRRDTYVAAIIGALMAEGRTVDTAALFFALANADEILKFADEHPEGSL